MVKVVLRVLGGVPRLLRVVLRMLGGTKSNRSGTETIISDMSNGKKGTKSTGSEGH